MIEDTIVNTSEKAYIAGIVDGEGTVTLVRKHRNEVHSPEVSVASTSHQLIIWLKNIIGAGVVCSKQKRSSRHRAAFTFKLRGNKALKLLCEIQKWLIIKRPHCELILNNYKKLTPRNGRYTENMLRHKMELVAQIKKLNSR